MRRIIRNKVYDTDKAKRVGVWDKGVDGFVGGFYEVLFKKHNGEYFVEDGCMYSDRDPAIDPIGYEAAQAWAREHMTVTEYMKEFEAPEAGVKISTCIEIDGRIMFEVKRAAAIAGVTLGEWITNAVRNKLNDWEAGEE